MPAQGTEHTTMNDGTGKFDSNTMADSKRPKHIVLSDTIALLKRLNVSYLTSELDGPTHAHRKDIVELRSITS